MWFRRIGILIIGISVYLFASNYQITGAVIGLDFNLPINFFAIVLFVIGIVLILTDRESSSAVLEERVEVYDDNMEKSEKNRKERHYFITDPKGAFGSNGVVSLSEFKREISRADKDYLQVVRSEYENGLIQLAHSQGHKAEVAKEFLRVLDPEYSEDSQDGSGLSREEKRELHLAFRGWDGNLSKVPKDVRRKYKIDGESGGKHITLYQEGYRNNPVSASSTPSVPMGDRLATLIIRMIEGNRRKMRKSA